MLIATSCASTNNHQPTNLKTSLNPTDEMAHIAPSQTSHEVQPRLAIESSINELNSASQIGVLDEAGLEDIQKESTAKRSVSSASNSHRSSHTPNRERSRSETEAEPPPKLLCFTENPTHLPNHSTDSAIPSSQMKSRRSYFSWSPPSSHDSAECLATVVSSAYGQYSR